MGNDCRIFVPELGWEKDHLTREEIAALKEQAAVASAGRHWNSPGGMVEAMLMNPRDVLLLADLCLDLYDRQPAEVKFPGRFSGRSGDVSRLRGGERDGGLRFANPPYGEKAFDKEDAGDA